MALMVPCLNCEAYFQVSKEEEAHFLTFGWRSGEYTCYNCGDVDPKEMWEKVRHSYWPECKICRMCRMEITEELLDGCLPIHPGCQPRYERWCELDDEIVSLSD